MTAKYIEKSAMYQISMNRKEAELLTGYSTKYGYLYAMLARCDDPLVELQIYVDNKFTVLRDLDAAILENA